MKGEPFLKFRSVSPNGRSVSPNGRSASPNGHSKTRNGDFYYPADYTLCGFIHPRSIHSRQASVLLPIQACQLE